MPGQALTGWRAFVVGTVVFVAVELALVSGIMLLWLAVVSLGS